MTDTIKNETRRIIANAFSVDSNSVRVSVAVTNLATAGLLKGTTPETVTGSFSVVNTSRDVKLTQRSYDAISSRLPTPEQRHSILEMARIATDMGLAVGAHLHEEAAEGYEIDSIVLEGRSAVKIILKLA